MNPQKLHTHIDFQRNEARSLKVENVSSYPESPATGQMVWKDNLPRWYNGTAWVTITGAGAYQGAIDASTEVALPVATSAGEWWFFSEAGDLGGILTPDVNAGDILIAEVDGASVLAQYTVIRINRDITPQWEEVNGDIKPANNKGIRGPKINIADVLIVEDDVEVIGKDVIVSNLSTATGTYRSVLADDTGKLMLSTLSEYTVTVRLWHFLGHQFNDDISTGTITLLRLTPDGIAYDETKSIAEDGDNKGEIFSDVPKGLYQITVVADGFDERVMETTIADDVIRNITLIHEVRHKVTAKVVPNYGLQGEMLRAEGSWGAGNIVFEWGSLEMISDIYLPPGEYQFQNIRSFVNPDIFTPFDFTFTVSDDDIHVIIPNPLTQCAKLTFVVSDGDQTYPLTGECKLLDGDTVIKSHSFTGEVLVEVEWTDINFGVYMLRIEAERQGVDLPVLFLPVNINALNVDLGHIVLTLPFMQAGYTFATIINGENKTIVNEQTLIFRPDTSADVYAYLPHPEDVKNKTILFRKEFTDTYALVIEDMNDRDITFNGAKSSGITATENGSWLILASDGDNYNTIMHFGNWQLTTE